MQYNINSLVNEIVVYGTFPQTQTSIMSASIIIKHDGLVLSSYKQHWDETNSMKLNDQKKCWKKICEE